MPVWAINFMVYVLEKVLESDMVEGLKEQLIQRLREKAADSESPIDDWLVELFAAILGV